MTSTSEDNIHSKSKNAFSADTSRRPDSSPAQLESPKRASKPPSKKKGRDITSNPSDNRNSFASIEQEKEKIKVQLTPEQQRHQKKLEKLSSSLSSRTTLLILNVHADEAEKANRKNKIKESNQNYIKQLEEEQARAEEEFNAPPPLSREENLLRVQEEWDTPQSVRDFTARVKSPTSGVSGNDSTKSDTTASTTLSRLGSRVSSRVGGVFKSLSTGALDAMARYSPYFGDRQVGIITDDDVNCEFDADDIEGK